MNDKVTAAVTEIANTFKAQIKAYVIGYLENCVKKWQDDSLTTGFTDPWFIYPSSGNMNKYQYRANQYRRELIKPFLTSTRKPLEEWINQPVKQREQLRYSLVEDYKALIEQKAEQQATDEVQSFIHKMVGKLQGIIDAKGGLVSAEVHGYLNRNSIRFTFEDGTTFLLVNDMIINVSCLGKVFNQYPTRFHQVIYHRQDGTIASHNILSEDEAKSLFGVQPEPPKPLTARQQARRAILAKTGGQRPNRWSRYL